MSTTVHRPLMRIAEVAEILDVTPAHVYGLIHAGVIPHVRITERSIRVPRGAFAEWLAERNRIARESVRPQLSRSGVAAAAGHQDDDR